jgi:cysteine desulfurase NifS
MTTAPDNWTKTLCGICPAACWVEVAVEDGVLTDIRADPDHPLGMICRRGEHAPEIVYSQDRLRTPLRRVGPKGSFEFEPITWNEAYESIVANMERIADESGPEAMGIYTGRGAFEHALCAVFHPEGPVSSVTSVLFPFGSPNTMGVGALCYAAFGMIAPHVTMGRMLHEMYADVENADLVVVWGSNPATDSPPLDMRRLEAAVDRGARIIVIDPRRTDTVRRTDAQWIPIRPGTDGALALSMIEALIDEELLDEGFVDDWCHGFDELRQYTQHFTPEVVAQTTGIPAETIRQLARDIAAAGGACPLMYTGLEYSNGGVQAIRAALSVFALAGHLDKPGGWCLSMSGASWPKSGETNLPNPAQDRTLDQRAYPLYDDIRSECHALGLPQSVQSGTPYKMRGLIVHGGSLLTSWPQPDAWREVFSSLDFMVCIDRQMTSDCAYADIVLPAATGFEIGSYQTYGTLFREREPVIAPVGEARNDYLIMAELAQRLGYGHLYPQTEEDLVRHGLKPSGITLEALREAGGHIKLPSPMPSYRKWEKGLLRSDEAPGFATPTGKYELFSTILEDYGYDGLPRYTEPTEGPIAAPELAARFPLVFNSGARPHNDFRSQFHSIKGLVADSPEPLVELNHQDAEARGIQTGDLVQVETARGQVPFRARVTDNIVQGAIECNMGGGGAVGPKAWREWNANILTDLHNTDPISGFPVYKALLCQVVKLEAGTKETQALAAPRVHKVAAVKEKTGPSRRVYLDHNATTPILPQVREAMAPHLDDAWGNPSSLHARGERARKAVETGRRAVASLLHTRARRIVFTSGGTEADNLALKGVMLGKAPGTHLITTTIEHPAVLATADFLERLGYAVTRLPVDPQGRVSPDDLRAALRPETALVSIMMANNELGTLQPIAALAEICRDHGALFHTDAVQAVGKVPVDVEALGVDLLSLSAHKFGGPQGVGALYVRRGVHLDPLMHGGKQEAGLRGGTENVAGIAGLGRAASLASATLERQAELRRLRDRLEAGVRLQVPEATLNGHPTERLPGVLNLTLPGLRGEAVAIAMDHRGVAISAGSACKSGSPDPSHVLRAIGLDEHAAHCSVRFSLGRGIDEADIDFAIEALGDTLVRLEGALRYLFCK